MPKKIIIVGGGLTGLAAARRLKHLDIQLIEASPRLGGTLHTTARDGYLLEGGPDCFISDKPRGVELCQELGLADQLIQTRPENRRSFIVRGGKLHPVPEGFYLIAPSKLRPFLQSDLLSWIGKWRVLIEPLLPARPQTDESLMSFVSRRLGRETLDYLAQPLLAGIYAADPETLGLQATFPQFLEMERKYGSVLVGLKKRGEATRAASGARYSLFMSLRGGMQTLSDRLEKELPASAIRRNTSVSAVRRDPNGGWIVRLANGEILPADGVCLALPAYACGDLLKDEHPTLASELTGIPYTSSATLNFGFPESAIGHPLDGFGFVTPILEQRTTLACTFVHRKFAERAASGRALLRAFIGGALQGELLDYDDADLIKRVTRDLQDLLGITGEPEFCAIERWRRAMPQYAVGHVQRILKIEELLLGLKGLSLAGNWQRGVGIPDCIASGERAADLLAQ